MLTAAQLNTFQTSFKFTPPAYAGLQKELSIVEKITHTNVANTRFIQESWTPTNDYRYLYQTVDGPPPNFLYIAASGHFNITITTALGFMVFVLPCFKGLYLSMPTSTVITGIYLEGRLGGNIPIPMAQGVDFDFMAVMGNAEVA